MGEISGVGGWCKRLFFLVRFWCSAQQGSQDEVPQGGRQHDAEAVGAEVGPLAAAVGRQVGLCQFDASAHGDGADDGPWQQAAPAFAAVSPQKLPPDDRARAKIHQRVRPFVDAGVSVAVMAGSIN